MGFEVKRRWVAVGANSYMSWRFYFMLFDILIVIVFRNILIREKGLTLKSLAINDHLISLS